MKAYLKHLFCIVCIHVTPIDPIIELFELQQVLVDRVKRLNFIILADEA